MPRSATGRSSDAATAARPMSSATRPNQRAIVASDRERRSGQKEIDASAGDHRAEAAREATAVGLAERESDADAEHVDHAGRDHEADRVIGGIGGIGQLNAVGIAVADRENADDDERDRFDRAPGEGYGPTERE